MRKFSLGLLFFLLLQTQTKAQSLEEYIDEGLKNNVVLKGKIIDVDKALIALREANSLFLPTVNFEMQYTLAKGGRSIDIPIGDLLNPVYKALNQIMGVDGYPTVYNMSEQLFPDNFYDTRVKTTMPIINPEIKINGIIKKQEIVLHKNEVESYKRELVKDIKVAYYKYLMASEAIRIYENALIVVKQNLKVNQSLLANGKGLPAYVSRASFEVKSMEEQIQIALNEQQNAKVYFNFLLNKPLNESIHISAVHLEEDSFKNIVIEPHDVTGREELKNMTVALEINHNVLQLNRSFRTPRLNGFIDVGAQGFDFKINNKSLFYLAGLQLQVPIFAGKRNLYKIEQTKLNEKNLALQWEQVRDKLKIAATVSYNNLRSAYSTYKVSLNQQEPVKDYYHLIDRGYKEGTNSFIEFLDASKQLIDIQLQLNINKFKFLVVLADFERQTASYAFK